MHAIGWQSPGERVASAVDPEGVQVGENLAAGSLEGRSKKTPPWLLRGGARKSILFT